MTQRFYHAAGWLLAAAAFIPQPAAACACGCNIFDIGDGSLTPMASDSGASLWLRYDTLVQNQMREHGHRANPADNPDQRIATDFTTIGGEYRLSPRWTVMVQVPLVTRHFTTTDDGTYAAPAGTVDTRGITALGDTMLRATYTGLTADMANGLSIGIKLPTGRSVSPLGPLGGAGFDRDTMPGSGSTDLQVGAYHVGHLGTKLRWFAQGQYQFAVMSRDGYRPGNEADAALGLSYPLGGGGLAPSLALLGSLRAGDSGINGDPGNSGYTRVLVAPGLKLRLGRRVSFYGDVEVAVVQYARSAPVNSGVAGQLTAPVQFKVQVNYAL